LICASINNVVVHGIPGDGPEHTLAEGDIVSIDCGAIVDGWHGDAAFTAPVGTVTAEAGRLISTAEDALAAAIAAMRPGGRLGDVGAAVEDVVQSAGLDGVREYCGHGIGRAMHEWPDVPNFGRPGHGPRLVAGSVLAIEPMVVAGAPDVELDRDGWTVRTGDGGWAAHIEHTVAVTDDGPVVLTTP
jgi:methionyl aminopeptidase